MNVFSWIGVALLVFGISGFFIFISFLDDIRTAIIAFSITAGVTLFAYLVAFLLSYGG